jgi:pimeloyl-ACP methyl ester carboxylesterase
LHFWLYPTMKRIKTMSALFVLAALLGGWWLWTPDEDRAALEARYAAPPSSFVTVSGLRLHLRDTGPRDRPALILLHGFGDSLHAWDAWAQTLEQEYRVIRIDLPGGALTGPDATGDYSDERAVQILVGLMDQLALPKASFIGHSMGGRIAWRLASEQPQRVDRLVLVAPDGFASPGFEYGKPADFGPGLGLMKVVLPRMLVRMSLKPAYADPALITDETVDRLWNLVRAPGVRGALLDRLRQWVPQDPAPRLARIAAPTLLMWGEQDAMIPVANAQDYLKAVPNARLVTLPGVGHLPHEEAPAASLPALQAFLGGAPP